MKLRTHRDWDEIPQKISNNRAINHDIQRYLRSLNDINAAWKFVRGFESNRHDELNQLNRFNELQVGGYFALRGYQAIYEPDIGGKTPDWIVKKSRVGAIVESSTLHTYQKMRDPLRSAPLGRAMAFRVDDDLNIQRLWGQIDDKVGKYGLKSLQNGYPFVVAVTVGFDTCLSLDEIAEEHASSLKRLFPDSLSGVLFLQNVSGELESLYIANQSAALPFVASDSEPLEL